MSKWRFYLNKVKREYKQFHWYRLFDWIHIRAYSILFVAILLLFLTLIVAPTTILVIVTFLLVLLLLSMTR